MTFLILHNKTLKLSQFTLLLMVVKFVNVQGIKLLYKHHTEENIHVYTCSVTIAEFQKKVHLPNKLLTIYWHVNVVPLLKSVTTEYKHAH